MNTWYLVKILSNIMKVHCELNPWKVSEQAYIWRNWKTKKKHTQWADLLRPKTCFDQIFNNVIQYYFNISILNNYILYIL